MHFFQITIHHILADITNECRNWILIHSREIFCRGFISSKNTWWHRSTLSLKLPGSEIQILWNCNENAAALAVAALCFETPGPFGGFWSTVCETLPPPALSSASAEGTAALSQGGDGAGDRRCQPDSRTALSSHTRLCLGAALSSPGEKATTNNSMSISRLGCGGGSGLHGHFVLWGAAGAAGAA